MNQQHSYLVVSQEGAVLTILLNNPPLNLLAQPLKSELIALLDGIAADSSIRALVIAGAGVRAFSAGADIKEFPERLRLKSAGEASRRGQLLIEKLYRLPQPVIAAIRGYCFGGGMELALACDFRIAGKGSTFGMPEVKRGIFPGTSGTQLLPRLVGMAKAKEIMMLGDPFGADEAHRVGLVTHLVDDDEVLNAAASMARTLAERPACSVRAIKKLVNQGVDLPLEQGLRLETELFERIFETEDVREGVAAFFEKREPRFKHC